MFFFLFFLRTPPLPHAFLIPCLPILRDAAVSKGKVDVSQKSRVLIQEAVHKFEESIDCSVLREPDK